MTNDTKTEPYDKTRYGVTKHDAPHRWEFQRIHALTLDEVEIEWFCDHCQTYRMKRYEAS